MVNCNTVMKALDQKRVLLGVTGGIAAYKSAQLVRRLRDIGAQVRVVMTEAAAGFVTPLTFQALSGHRVYTHLMAPDQEAAMDHISLARWADVVLVAPATANFLAKLTHGIADDLLSTLCLSLESPLAVAPAMNQAMWSNPATQENIKQLSARGIRLFGPGIGAQACGEVGFGRMLEPDQLLERLAGVFATGALAGCRVLVTAGPTREAIDPVRYIGNRSSGKMGYSMAAAAAEAGARVLLVSGPVALSPPDGVECVEVESAAEMFGAVMSRVADFDILIATAAVADYRPRVVAKQKIKKSERPVGLDLEPTEDILAAVAKLELSPFTVGFSAETERLEENTEAKRRKKSVDLMAANQVGVPNMGFDSDDNALQLFWEGGNLVLMHAPKQRLARQLVAIVAQRYRLTRKRVATHAGSLSDL
ncbi:MAG: bifunctional phosphopantothenoylcysteine decarboxylase/phosphopantothenate--cysteine ligase CoaBC [Gammaproteobacteria bacterium]